MATATRKRRGRARTIGDRSSVGDQFAALLGTFSLRPSGYLVLAVQAVMIAAITAWASRRTLYATLDEIE